MPLSKPLISVVIPSYNGLTLLQVNLPRVLAVQGIDEVIVVDDASNDGTVTWLKREYPQVKVLVNQKNIRFGRSCNRGIKTATGDLIVLLNNDVKVSMEFLAPLISVMADPIIFAAGCAEYDQDKVVSGRGAGAFRRGMLVHWKHPQQETGETLWVTGGSGIFRKKMWLELGGFDEAFGPAYDEDRDICYRAWRRGWRCWFVRESKVWHQHETTNEKALGKSLMQIASFKNQFLMVWKQADMAGLCTHLVWLPYQIVVGGWRSSGRLLLGFLWAFGWLPKVVAWRLKESTHWRRGNREVLGYYVDQ